MLERLYGQRPGYRAFRRGLEAVLREAWAERSDELKWLDLERDLNPDWFQRPDMAGYVFYADRFAGNLEGVRQRLDYLADLGITYIHVMPCLTPRPGDSDGGYSVMDYTRIDPRLGTMADFERLCAEARARGMSVCIDMVLNHTAKEHAWAEAALGGGAPKYEDFYITFETDELPRDTRKACSRSFPRRPGAVHPLPRGAGGPDDLQRVYSGISTGRTRGLSRDDAGYASFSPTAASMSWRLDAVAFMWKRMGFRFQGRNRSAQCS